MGIIRNPKLTLIPVVEQQLPGVSNFSKAVVTFDIRMLSLASYKFKKATATITLFEIVTESGVSGMQRIVAKKKILSGSLLQHFTIDFNKSSSFPGPSVFGHSYIALIRIKAKTGNAVEQAFTNIAELEAASLVAV